MKKTTYFTIIFLILNFKSQAQEEPKTLRVDINNNKIVDILKPLSNSIEIKIDNKPFSIRFDDLGFEKLDELSYKNNILNIGGYNEGTGAYYYLYKFRNNKTLNKIELIGYEYSYKWPTGNFNRSFNAVTKKYEIIVAEYNEKKDGLETTTHTGKLVTKPILLTNLSNSDLNKVVEVGKQYEKE